VKTRALVLVVIGALMVALGAYVAGRMLATRGGALTGNRLLDGAFAFFFLLRGAMNIAAARRLQKADPT